MGRQVVGEGITVEEAEEVLPKNREWIEGMCSMLPAGLEGRLEPFCQALRTLEKEEAVRVEAEAVEEKAEAVES